ncbi:MAG: TylF/MycF/NovP-related O-methyltransferase [Candidatus Saccharimonadales bacterium]
MSNVTLLSDQVDKRELGVILRELLKTLDTVAGDVVEFGCYTGTTSVHLAHFLAPTTKELYVYDSFAGLPAKTSKDSSPAGEQFKEGELLATKKQLVLNFKKARQPLPHIIKGWFCDVTSADVPSVISFAFLDGDYYDSILDPLKLIWPKLSPGAVVIVDDYASEALPGAARAVDDWLKTHSARLRVESSLAIISL